jgi:hypothetical protein
MSTRNWMPIVVISCLHSFSLCVQMHWWRQCTRKITWIALGRTLCWHSLWLRRCVPSHCCWCLFQLFCSSSFPTSLKSLPVARRESKLLFRRIRRTSDNKYWKNKLRIWTRFQTRSAITWWYSLILSSSSWSFKCSSRPWLYTYQHTNYLTVSSLLLEAVTNS